VGGKTVTLKPLFLGKRANFGATLFIAVILFNIIMYIFIRVANADAMADTVGGYDEAGSGIDSATTSQDLSLSGVTHWYDGFNVSVLGLPWYFSIFYATLQGVLISISLYSLIRGLS